MSLRKTRSYEVVCNKPVAKFFYKGDHSHPVRRTVLVIENRPDCIVGYELREGKQIRTLNEALRNIKSYRKDRIARWGDYCRLRGTSNAALYGFDRSTLQRLPISKILREGA